MLELERLIGTNSLTISDKVCLNIIHSNKGQTNFTFNQNSFCNPFLCYVLLALPKLSTLGSLGLSIVTFTGKPIFLIA